ncbi:glycoside hydrolase family 99-like domain-containing protein [Allokutzneria multivorans]|uniref:glycoside hydrolase family 99-like domain-containing protein n=1 Tax=Allokutzneria multivorans TaxID=1142134 RepID=UPI0031F057D2
MLRRLVAAPVIVATVVVAALAGFGVPEPAKAQSSPAKVTDPVPMIELRTPAGGRFYTLSPREAADAVSKHRFTREPGQVGYWRTASFFGSQPVFRLRGGSGYLLTASTSERDALVKQGFADEGVTGHLWSTQQPGMERLLRFSKSGEWRVAFESRSGELTGQGYRADGPLGWGHTEWIRAGAIYFGTFNPASTDVIGATKRTFGRDGDYWGGVRDFSGRDPAVAQNTQGWSGNFSHLSPSIGFYDDSKPATLEKHIDQATGAGLDFFQFYWYWDTTKKKQPERFDVSLNAFGAARNRLDIDYTLTVCAHPWGNLGIPKEDFGTVADDFVRHFRQPNFLRANDGRLLLTLCDRRGIGNGSDADTREFISVVRQRAASALGEDIMVLGYWEAMLDPAAPERWGTEGAYCGVRIDHEKSYARYAATLPEYLAKGPSQFMRCAAQNFDERPRFPHLIPDRSKIRFYPDQTPELFGDVLSTLRKDIAGSRRISAVDNFVSIYAWNEWHEGGIIEPNARDGCRYLGIVHDSLGLRTGKGC